MDIDFIKTIGDGGYADIWLGKDEIGRKVAIKILKEAGEGVSSLLQHAQALVRSKHTNVVDIYSIETLNVPNVGNKKCIIMEYIDGITLREKLGEEFSFKESFQMGKDIISGVQYIHSQGLVHMDLHTENILVTNSNNIKIIDIMYISSLSDVTSEIKAIRFEYDISQLIEILNSIIKRSPFKKEAHSEFNHIIGKQRSLDYIRRCYFDVFTIVRNDLHSSFILDAIKTTPEKLRHYKFRAEVEIDVDLLSKNLGQDIVSIKKSNQLFFGSDVELVTHLNLEQLRHKMREIEDGHVMVQTVAHYLDYTGNRDFNLS